MLLLKMLEKSAIKKKIRVGSSPTVGVDLCFNSFQDLVLCDLLSTWHIIQLPLLMFAFVSSGKIKPGFEKIIRLCLRKKQAFIFFIMNHVQVFFKADREFPGEMQAARPAEPSGVTAGTAEMRAGRAGHKRQPSMEP
jgi:hypothetical protein